MSILHVYLSNPSAATQLFLASRFSHLSIAQPPKPTVIRMGGGPRTYPGGVSKWQWKRMQQKKAKQLLRARLARERQIYEMRKRAELRAAVSELERPWEVVEKAPKLFSTSADEQLKVLADRFQKPGGFDLWSEKDGPQLFETVDGLPTARFFPKGVVHSIKPYGRITDGGLSEDSRSGLVQRNEQGENSRNGNGNGKSGKNGNRRRIEMAEAGTGYQNVDLDSDMDLGSGLVQRNGQDMNSRNAYVKSRRKGNTRRIEVADGGVDRFWNDDQGLDREAGLVKRNGQDENSRSANGRIRKNVSSRRNGINGTADVERRYQFSDDGSGQGLGQRNGQDQNGKYRKNGNRRTAGMVDMGSNSSRDGLDNRGSGARNIWRGNGKKVDRSLNSKVFDMSLQEDGSYGMSNKEMGFDNGRIRTERK